MKRIGEILVENNFISLDSLNEAIEEQKKNNFNIAEKISKLVSTDYYHVSTSDDVVGVETCAAIKNIFSMAVGASQGLCDAKQSKEKN